MNEDAKREKDAYDNWIPEDRDINDAFWNGYHSRDTEIENLKSQIVVWKSKANEISQLKELIRFAHRYMIWSKQELLDRSVLNSVSEIEQWLEKTKEILGEQI